MLRRRADSTMQAIVLRVSGAGDTPPPSASRAASAAGQSLSAPREQGVPGGAADYHKILNESPLVVLSLETKLLDEPAQPCRGPATRAPWPNPRTTPSQSLRPNSDWPRAGVFQAKIRPSSAACPTRFMRRTPPHVCLLSSNPGGLHPPFISPPLFILQSSLASRHLREASDPPPTQFPILPKPRTASSPRFDHLSPPISRFRLKSRPPPRFVPASYPGPGRRCPSPAEIDAAWQTWRQGSSGET